MLRQICCGRGLASRAHISASANGFSSLYRRYASCTSWLPSVASLTFDGDVSTENESLKATPMVTQYLARKKEYPGDNNDNVALRTIFAAIVMLYVLVVDVRCRLHAAVSSRRLLRVFRG